MVSVTSSEEVVQGVDLLGLPPNDVQDCFEGSNETFLEHHVIVEILVESELFGEFRDEGDNILTDWVGCLQFGELNLLSIIDDVVLVLDSVNLEVVVVEESTTNVLGGGLTVEGDRVLELIQVVTSTGEGNLIDGKLGVLLTLIFDVVDDVILGA